MIVQRTKSIFARLGWVWGFILGLSGLIIAVVLIMATLSGITSCIDNASKNAAIPPPPGITATPTVTPSVPIVTDPASPVPTVTDSPSPSATTSSPSSSDCPVPSEPDRSVAINQFEPASNLAWMEDLEGYDRIVYAGVPASAEELKIWVNAAACNGMVAEIQSGKVLGNGSVLATAQGTFCWGDWPATGECAPSEYLPLYLPYPEPNTYGKVSSYTEVGRAASSGWAAVQAYGHWESGDDMKDKFGFRKQEDGRSRPSADEVGDFANMLHKSGINRILVYQQGDAGGDKNYLNEVARAVRKVINQ